jgi:hypothetical protein
MKMRLCGYTYPEISKRYHMRFHDISETLDRLYSDAKEIMAA